jgi:formimidoylglutamate deiminase
LLSALVFGLSPRAVRDVAVGGRLVVRDGRHAGAERSSVAFERLQVSLWS